MRNMHLRFSSALVVTKSNIEASAFGIVYEVGVVEGCIGSKGPFFLNAFG